MAALWLHTTLLLVLLATWCPGSGGFPLETLCGSDLLDAINFVCGDRGFFFMAKTDDDPVQRSQALSKMGKRSVVYQCCFRPCDIFTLQSFCV